MKRFVVAWLMAFSLFANVDEAREKLLMELSGEWIARGLYVVNRLNIADHLNEGPLAIDRLSELAGCDKDHLNRIMHMLASKGIFEEIEPHVYKNSEASALLSSRHPAKLKSIAQFYGEEVHLSLDALLACVEKGETAFNLVYGQPVFRYFKENPERKELFQAAMKEKSKAVIESAIEVYPFSKYGSVFDIGGGNGAFLALLKHKYPEMKGVLFELPEVIAEVKSTQFKSIPGDFFKSIPEGGDLYLMKSILHDWSDENAVLILKNCQKAMKPESRLLIIEAVLLPGGDSIYANAMDVLMMAMTGGKERNYAEYAALLKEAGLEIENIYKTSTEFLIIEAKKS